jgi:hypothetical protein
MMTVVSGIYLLSSSDTVGEGPAGGRDQEWGHQCQGGALAGHPLSVPHPGAPKKPDKELYKTPSTIRNYWLPGTACGRGDRGRKEAIAVKKNKRNIDILNHYEMLVKHAHRPHVQLNGQDSGSLAVKLNKSIR